MDQTESPRSNGLDQIDAEIVRLLLSDGRMPWNKIAVRVGLTGPAVGARVRRLEEQGVITGYRASVNPAKLGRPLRVVLRLTSTGGAVSCRKISSLADRLKEVEACYHVTGGEHFVLVASLRSTRELAELIDRFASYSTVASSVVLDPPRDAG